MVRLKYLSVIVILAFSACDESRVVSSVPPPLPPPRDSIGRIVPIPAAAKIAFVSERDGNSEIYAANEDGTGQVRVTYHGAKDVSPAWSPDGSRLAFASDRGGAWEIYTVNADGSDLVQRTHGRFIFARGPAWSPDGRKIAFSGTCGSAYSTICINVIDAESVSSANPILLIRDFIFNSFDPAWSLDGSEIAFVSDENTDEAYFEVFVAKADGSRTVQVTHGVRRDYPTYFSVHPAYSRDGRVALLHYVSPGQRDVVELGLMNADGTGLTTITEAGTTSRWAASMPPSLTWSPDGSRIAFTMGDCYGTMCDYSIAVVKPDGTDKRVIIADGHSPTWRR